MFGRVMWRRRVSRELNSSGVDVVRKGGRGTERSSRVDGVASAANWGWAGVEALGLMREVALLRTFVKVVVRLDGLGLELESGVEGSGWMKRSIRQSSRGEAVTVRIVRGAMVASSGGALGVDREVRKVNIGLRRLISVRGRCEG